MYELLDRIVRVEHVRGCIVFDLAGQPLADRTSGASAETRAALRLLVEQMQREHVDEARRELTSYRLFARRIDNVICGVVAGRSIDEATLRMQLNIFAIKLSAAVSSARAAQAAAPPALPSNAVHALERELVSDVGPLGKVLFEGALKRIHATVSSLTADEARELSTQLAGEIPERSRRGWLARSSAIIEAACTGLPRPLPPLVRADSAPKSGERPKSDVNALTGAGSRKTG